MNAQPHDIAAMESLLAFWRDAGVDACYGDAPIDHTHVAPPPALKAVQRATASVVARPTALDGGADGTLELARLVDRLSARFGAGAITRSLSARLGATGVILDGLSDYGSDRQGRGIAIISGPDAR